MTCSLLTTRPHLKSPAGSVVFEVLFVVSVLFSLTQWRSVAAAVQDAHAVCSLAGMLHEAHVELVQLNFQ